MADKLTCPGCGETVESAEHLEKAHDVPEVQIKDGEIHLYENRNLFMCKSCKKPLGVGK
jgi:hypothetical protein